MFNDPIERRLRELPVAALDPHAEARIAAALRRADRPRRAAVRSVGIAAAVIAAALSAWALRAPTHSDAASTVSTTEPIVVQVSLDRPLFGRAQRTDRVNVLNWR